MSENHDDVSIVACPNGPFLVRGSVTLTTPDGEPLPHDRRTVALCRCGKSVLKPFCDGTHKMIGFVTETEPSSRHAAVDHEGEGRNPRPTSPQPPSESGRS